MSGLGEILKNERLKKNILIDEIARKTNINEKILIDLENNDFQHIPGKFYIYNFLKSYLKALDIDEKTFFRNHGDAIELVIKQHREQLPVFYNKITYSRFKRKRLFLGIVFLILASILITYLVVENQDRILKLFGWHSKPNIIPETGLIFNLEQEDIRVDFSPIRIEVESVSDCWIQIYRGNRKYTERILKKGEIEKINGYELLITIGNPSSTNLTINEKEISKYKNSSRPLKLYITPENLNSI